MQLDEKILHVGPSNTGEEIHQNIAKLKCSAHGINSLQLRIITKLMYIGVRHKP